MPLDESTAPEGSLRELSRSQQGMFVAEDLWGCNPSPFHVLVSARIDGQVEVERLRAALRQLSVRHAELRTVYTRHRRTGARGRRVLSDWTIPLEIREGVPSSNEQDPVDATHAAIGPEVPLLLQPAERPPVLFILTRIRLGLAVLSLVGHHAVLDGWSVGLLWREIAETYAGPEVERTPAPDMDLVVARERGERTRKLAEERSMQLAEWPAIVQLPTDLQRPTVHELRGHRLRFSLSEAATVSCGELVAHLGVGRNAAVLAAWALVCARRAGQDRLLVGVPALGRRVGAELRVVGGCASIAPVTCELPDGTVAQYVRGVAQALMDSLRFTEVPFEDLVERTQWSTDLSRCPLIQIGFGAHDDLVHIALPAGGITFTVTPGHTGATAYDAVLHLFEWTPHSRFELEYSTSALTEEDAAALGESLDATLVQMAAALDDPLAIVTTISAGQLSRLKQLEMGPSADASHGIWQLFDKVARRTPDAVAVRDSDPAQSLSYRQLALAAAAESAQLESAGVREGDCVALALRRSVREIVSVLAVLRIGAAYVGLDHTAPPELIASILERAKVAVIVGDAEGIAALGESAASRVCLLTFDPWMHTDGHFPEPAPADPDRIAYVAFTSGTTGEPKGAMVACSGVVRLTYRPRFLTVGAAKRFLRLAPLAFDASTLEIFAPLLSGGTVEVFSAEYPTPRALANFLQDRSVTGLWLTAGLFRLLADFRPSAFAPALQLLTGGDVVPPGQVSTVLAACPGLRISNGYGPTENTTFTTVYHVDAPLDVVATDIPIGRPIQGSGVLILDAAGRRVPLGAVGELCAAGVGLAGGYLGMPEETARAFGSFAHGESMRLYRTGDLVRWDGQGNLRFVGRRDRQVKIRGFRVEPDHVAEVMRAHPSVSDAIAVIVPLCDGQKQILVGVRPAEGRAPTPESLHSFAARRLPTYAVPSLWVVMEQFPVTQNGKVDLSQLILAAASSISSVGARKEDRIHDNHNQR